jgi:ubiquinone/menaquinone biosynthesis C-methylase UbiE
MARMNNKPSTPKNLRVCPWWLCFTFDNILRRVVQNPDAILRPYVQPGMTALDIGAGMGYFTIPLARRVGDSGRVFAADLQEKMLDSLFQRAKRAGVQNRITLHLTASDRIGLTGPVDFCLAFWMLHEVVDQPRFIKEICSIVKPGGLFLLVEPWFHVSRNSFNKVVQISRNNGFSMVEKPGIFLSNSALFKRTVR